MNFSPTREFNAHQRSKTMTVISVGGGAFLMYGIFAGVTEIPRLIPAMMPCRDDQAAQQVLYTTTQIQNAFYHAMMCQLAKQPLNDQTSPVAKPYPAPSPQA